MDIQVLAGSNEHEKRFQFDLNISQTEKTYKDATEALVSPMASKIFGFPWTSEITVGPNFLLLTKQDWVDWDVLEEPLKSLMLEHFTALSGAIEENPEPAVPTQKGLESDEAKKIQVLIENEINPALASHNGYVVLHSVEADKVFLEMGGGCQGCAMSYQTLKEGIEGAIKSAVPSISEVVDVTNHSAGTDPFYSQKG